MGSLEQLRKATPEVTAAVETTPAPVEAKADRPPVDPDGSLPDFPFCLRSHILDAEIWIVPDAWPDSVPGPAYSHSEVATLARERVMPEDLKAIHKVKLAFDGTIIG